MIDVERQAFEDLVADALDRVPAGLLALMDNVVVMVEDLPPEGEEGLLGLYDGVPLTERGVGYGSEGIFVPDVVTIFRLPILEICETEDDVIREVEITVVHEIAHHFGIDDDRLHALGYG